jgi:hypothetical protein
VWSVNINGVTKQTNTNQIIFYEANGQYSYQIYGTKYYVNQNQFYTYVPSPASGTITVNNGDVNINITFTGTQTPIQDTYSSQTEITDILNNLKFTGSFSVNNGDIYSSQAEISNVLNALNLIGSFSVNGGDVYSGQSDSFTYTNS